VANFFKNIVEYIKLRFLHAQRDSQTGGKRSPLWKKVRKDFLKQHRTCVICGSKTGLQVHHKKPFHLYPEFELDPTNLVTVCMSFRRHCHLKIAHGGNFISYVPEINKLVSMSKGKAERFEELVVYARNHRIISKLYSSHNDLD
jgi:hypothetical protein